MKTVPAPSGPWTAAVALTAVLHYVWEMAQAPFFTNFVGVPLLRHAVACLVATLGDLLISGVSYFITAAAFGRLAWPLRRGWRGAAVVWVSIGLAKTALIERWAISTGRWGYTPTMPQVFRLGLLPLLQWVVVPTATLVFLRRLTARPAQKIGGSL